MTKIHSLTAAVLGIIISLFMIVPGDIHPQAVIPRPEHPRPDFQREESLNLNGTWRFSFDPDDAGKREEWFAPGRHEFPLSITVPYPWESPLSGIQRPEYQGAAWYRRAFSIPAEWQGKRVVLSFGAVDYLAEVWINGTYAGSHEGGYTPFSMDITDLLKGNSQNILAVRAFDATSYDQPHGKQVGWYTRTSGIWQTVYLEAVPSRSRLEYIHVKPDIDQERLYWTLGAQNAGPAGNYTIVLESVNGEFPRMEVGASLNEGKNDIVFDFPFRNGILWSPENPHIYEANVSLVYNQHVLDRVRTYFGYRKISSGKAGANPNTHILLNNNPVYLMGALNQAFHPLGIYTYPSDDAIREDIRKAKEFGFNFLRLHIKVDEPRFYYWADRLGILIMSDLPNFREENERSRQSWEKTLRETVLRDFNHPSIISWCLFNETWGLDWRGYYAPDTQKWVESMYYLAKRLDPTRLVEDNSACNYDHVKTDIHSWHFYLNDYERARAHIRGIVDFTFPGSYFNYIGGYRQGNEPLINSEYGGISAGMGDKDISWCFKYLTNEQRMHEKICGYIYTELQDIEWEHNGFMDYDRRPKDFGYGDVSEGFSVLDLNNPDFVVIDKEPCPRVRPGSHFSADIYFSHYSGKPVSSPVLRWTLAGTDHIGEYGVLETGVQPIAVEPWRVVKAATISFRIPQGRYVGTLTVAVEDRQGNKIARNYINLDIAGDPEPRVESPVGGITILRFDPRDYAETTFRSTIDEPASGGEKVSGMGTGRIRYSLKLPDDLDLDRVTAVSLLFEGAARAGLDKVDARFQGFPWARKRPADYPQTDETKRPSDVTVLLNGIDLQTVKFADDPADARGILSHASGYDPGSYGYLTRVNPSPAQLSSILSKSKFDRSISVEFEVRDEAVNKNGFALYGDRLGRYAVDPELIFETKAR